MANIIRHKRSATTGTPPLTGDLLLGELGVNTFDGKLYLKRSNVDTEGDASEAIVQIGAVQSVNGLIDTVVLTTTEVAQGANLYYTETLVSANVDVAANSLHRADGTIHFTEASIDHANIIGAGVTSHIAIDDHIGDGTIHFTQAAISISESQIGDLQSYLLTETDPVFTAQKGAANGVATLDATSKIPTSQLPALAITDTYVVADEAARLLLTAQVGDVAVQQDNNTSYILQVADPSIPGNWVEIITPGSGVISVNGLTGAVTLTTSEIAEGTNLYYTETRVSANTDVAANTAHGVLTTNPHSTSVVNLSDTTITTPALNEVLTFDGTVWVNQTTGSLSNVVDDLAPQLGGNLDVNGKTITSAAGGNIVLIPDTTGTITIGNSAATAQIVVNSTASVDITGDVAVSGNLVAHLGLSEVLTIPHTLALADDGTMVTMSNTAAILLTVPRNSDVVFPIGSQIIIEQGDVGQVTIVPGVGVVINSANALLSTASQYSTIMLVKKAADLWLLTGDLA